MAVPITVNCLLMPNPTRSNHFSPAFSNRYWANPSGSITRIYRAADGSIRKGKTSAKKWGCEDYLHPQEVEDAFSKIEHVVAPIYEKLLEKELLDVEERMIWSFWILCQFSRTPTMTLELAGMPEDILRTLDIEFDPSWKEIGESFESLASHGLEFPMNDDLLAFIVLRDWIVLRPAPGEFFIKGDTPVVIRGALVDDDAEIVYPMAPDACFVATVRGSFPPSQILAEATLNPGCTNYYQRLVASKAERQVICRPDHFSSELSATVAKFLGTNTRHIHHSTTPNW